MARKILLADDSVTAQNMGRRILSDAGYEVTTVNNGSAALKKIADIKPDLIVLDVYMPGYGGLEVCQRLRESEETARIPVLLTVGKLEPFKVEEVRRVRADAFIVKPFEASELLTALTKLEDKIVPMPQPRKPGRFPKPGAAVDDMPPSGRVYGDSETGWKNRLRIPPPHQKREPSEPDSQPEPEAKAVEAKETQTKAVLNLPSDITADEIAAIQAAAAAFSTPEELAAKEIEAKAKTEVEAQAQKSDEAAKDKPIAEPETVSAQSVASAESSAEATALAKFEAASSLSVSEASTPAEVPATSQAEAPTESSGASETIAEASDVPSPAAQQPGPDDNKLAEHEVAAVLASLQAVTGSGEPEDEPLFATIAAARLGQELSGPRWVAASVPLSQDESSLILEQEMQKALAAMAAMASEAQAAAAVTESASNSAGVETTSAFVSNASETKPEEPPAPSQAEPQSVSAIADAVASVAEPAVVQEQAAFAAAASAGSTASETTISMEAASPALAPENTPSAETVEPQRESELAAAWVSWKEIRESVVSPQLESRIAEAAEPPAASPSAEEKQTESTAVIEQEVTANPADESEAIASIVDSVLADLKPKLMEQIAKKMAKEKKK